MFAVGLAIALNVPTTAALASSGISMAVQMNTTQGVMILAQLWVMGRSFGPGWSSWLRVMLVIVMSMVFGGMLQIAVAITYAQSPSGSQPSTQSPNQQQSQSTHRFDDHMQCDDGPLCSCSHRYPHQPSATDPGIPGGSAASVCAGHFNCG